jgi:hypothetical protein
MAKTFNWKQLVKSTDSRYGQREDAYRWSNGRTFKQPKELYDKHGSEWVRDEAWDRDEEWTR